MTLFSPACANGRKVPTERSGACAQKRLQQEAAEQDAEAKPQEPPAPGPTEADPFGLDQIMQKEDATK